MSKHESYIRRCFKLAKLGGKETKRNPNVGAVIVYEDRIIGEGYHKQEGAAHAEVNAINSVKENDIKYLKKATIYVSLEPCNHIGKTGACTHLIVENKIPKVIISCLDPNPLVNGSGVAYLENHGIDVKYGLLEQEGLDIIRPFRIIHNHKRPYVILKFAQSLDGYMGKLNENVQISNSYTQILSHKWRSEIDAIMVGTNTVIVDDPSLTTRKYFGDNPIRVVLDKSLRIPLDRTIYKDSIQTIVFTEELNTPIIAEKEFITIDFNAELLVNILNRLYDKNIFKIMIEGGAQLLKSFVDTGLWNEARTYTTMGRLETGIKAPTITGHLQKEEMLGNDRLTIIYNK